MARLEVMLVVLGMSKTFLILKIIPPKFEKRFKVHLREFLSSYGTKQALRFIIIPTFGPGGPRSPEGPFI